MFTGSTSAAELVLAADGKRNYQIVVADSSPSPAIAESLAQTAKLVQTAFKANGCEIAVVSDAARDTKRPATANRTS